MKKIIFALLILLSVNGFAQKSLYDFKTTDIDGNEFDFASLKGKKVLIVNVASKCGLTHQYEELQKLYTLYSNRNFVIVAFPSNNFKGQEPGSNNEIKEFCTSNYQITFPLMSKIDVIGENKAPIYKWLTEKEENGKFDAEVKWNFQKFMIDENGQLVNFVLPAEKPMSVQILEWINND